MSSVADVPDEILVQRSQEGDEHAFAALYQRHQHDLLRFIHSRLGNKPETDSEALVQTVFAEFYRIPPLWPGSTVRAVLYKIARTVVAHHLQDFQLQHRGGSGRGKPTAAWSRRTLEEIDPIQANNEATRDQIRTLIHDLIDGLPSNEATAVRLVWLQRHTATEAGKILDWPASLVRWRIRRAFDHMREMLDAT